MTEEVCVFGCDPPKDEFMLDVEMNKSADGAFHGKQDHLNQAQRVQGKAHESCYREWYEKTYRVPFG